MSDNNIHKAYDNIQDFSEIAPYSDAQVGEKMAELVKEPGFEHAVRYVMPDVDYPAFAEKLKSVSSLDDFQIKVMGPFLELLVSTTTKGLSYDGLENIDPAKGYTFITNHRDIVLDASFLNLCFIREHLPLSEVAIGNNLLIYDWITDLVKLNRSFIVKRDVKVAQALDAARQLSAYIHYTVCGRNQSVWIAQREGRAKDSNDVTQESLVKMMSLAGDGDTKHNLLEINLLPVAISYEFDPNDYLKVREFVLRRRDPEFKKSQRDDLFSMETGILRQKGRVHFHFGRCINARLEKTDDTLSRNAVLHNVCGLIDNAIHCGYYMYPCNYIAFDEINGTARFADRYTEVDVMAFDDYIKAQLEKVEVDDITPEEHVYMREMMLSMYANPLKNQLVAKDSENF